MSKTTKKKIAILLLIITSLIGYLEWGGGKASFLYALEFDVIKSLFSNPGEVLHPFTLIPLLGQLLLIVSLFQKKPNKLLTLLGMACLGLLLGFILFIGIMKMNAKMILSTLPFLFTALYVLLLFRKQKKSSL